MDRETLKAWVHYVLLNPIDEHNFAHAQATKKLFEENARYREALEFCAYKFVEDPAVQICHECEFGYDKIASTAYKALKGE